MTGGAHGGDMPRRSHRCRRPSAAAAAGYALERRGDRGPTFGGERERKWNGNVLA